MTQKLARIGLIDPRANILKGSPALKKLILTPLQHIPFIHKGDNLEEIIVSALSENKVALIDGDILVITSKIISKAEGRQVRLSDVKPSPKAMELGKITGKDARLVELILEESNDVIRVHPGVLIVEHKLGFISANAGIDHSNVEFAHSEMDEVLLLPKDPDQSAVHVWYLGHRTLLGFQREYQHQNRCMFPSVFLFD